MKTNTKTRTKIIATAIAPDEYEALRELAFLKGKTISSLVREILIADRDVMGRMSSSAPTVTKLLVTVAN